MCLQIIHVLRQLYSSEFSNIFTGQSLDSTLYCKKMFQKMCVSHLFARPGLYTTETRICMHCPKPPTYAHNGQTRRLSMQRVCLRLPLYTPADHSHFLCRLSLSSLHCRRNIKHLLLAHSIHHDYALPTFCSRTFLYPPHLTTLYVIDDPSIYLPY